MQNETKSITKYVILYCIQEFNFSYTEVSFLFIKPKHKKSKTTLVLIFIKKLNSLSTGQNPKQLKKNKK